MPIRRGPEGRSTVLDTPDVAILGRIQVARVKGHEVIGGTTILSGLWQGLQAHKLPNRSFYKDLSVKTANVCDCWGLRVCGDQAPDSCIAFWSLWLPHAEPGRRPDGLEAHRVGDDAAVDCH